MAAVRQGIDTKSFRERERLLSPFRSCFLFTAAKSPGGVFKLPVGQDRARRLNAFSAFEVRILWIAIWETVSGYFYFLPHCRMQTRSSNENFCLSVKRLNCAKTVEKYVQIFTPYERSFSLVVSEEEWLVGATPSTWNRWSKIADFEPIVARSISPVTPSEKSLINTTRKSTTHFPMSLRWLLYVVPKPSKGGLKTQSVQNLNNKMR